MDEHAVLLSQGVRDVNLSPEPELVEPNLRLGRPRPAAVRLASFEREAIAKGQPWALARGSLPGPGRS
jgi:hypothetical protein